jgi:hypothetical protein
MADQGIHPEYHKQQESRHREAIDKIERKSDNKKKRINEGVGASITGASTGGVASGLPSSGPGGMPTP